LLFVVSPRTVISSRARSGYPRIGERHLIFAPITEPVSVVQFCVSGACIGRVSRVQRAEWE
jgi:hypothetical protein